MAVKKKPTSRPRTRSRVQRVEGDSREPDKFTLRGKSAEHRRSEPDRISGIARLLDTGEVFISSQLSEVVPVGRFAGITIGPFQLAWKLSAADMSVLADVDWDTDDPLTKEQQEVFDRVNNALRSTTKILDMRLNEDREAVDEAVRRFNQEELQEEKENRRSRR